MLKVKLKLFKRTLVVFCLPLLGLTGTLRAADDPFALIPQKMQPFVDKGEVSGIVTLVASRGKVLNLSAVGVSDIATGRKMQTDDLFWIASMSKPITATCVAILKDQGKLSFDDPVEKYLPEFRSQWVIDQTDASRLVLVRPTASITLRQLLTHTSGMGEYRVTGPHWTLEEMVKVIAREPLRFQPGTRWAYSTAGIDTLGRIVEVVSGVPFAQFMQQNILDPLGMKDTTFWPSAEQEKRYAHTYRLNPQSSKLEDAPITYMYGGAITDHQRPPLGGAGLFSTAEDIGKFYQMALNGGSLNGHTILSRPTLTEMTTNQIGKLTARPGMPWGLGFCIIEDPKAMAANTMMHAGSFGHGGAYGTNSWVDPQSGRVYVMMLERAGLRNPDDSDMHRVFQETAAAVLEP